MSDNEMDYERIVQKSLNPNRIVSGMEILGGTSEDSDDSCSSNDSFDSIDAGHENSQYGNDGSDLD